MRQWRAPVAPGILGCLRRRPLDGATGIIRREASQGRDIINVVGVEGDIERERLDRLGITPELIEIRQPVEPGRLNTEERDPLPTKIGERFGEIDLRAAVLSIAATIPS